MGLNRDLTRPSQSEFCNGGPVSKHSFIDTKSLFGLDEASKTILILVVSADSRITELLAYIILSLSQVF